MTLTVKNVTLLVAISAGLSACDALQITGGPLEIGAALSSNLLDRGGFERGFGNWRACSDPQLVSLKSNETRTESSAVLDAGGCLYQMVPAQVNDNMLVNCSASKTTTNWASMTFGYLDEDYQPLKTVEAEIPDTNFTNVNATLRAPQNTAYAEVLIYAQDGAEIDNCELTNLAQGQSSEALINSYFEEGLNGWQACSHGTVTAENNTVSINNSCISQQFTASEGLALELTCNGIKTGNEHAAVALGYLDENFQGIELTEAAFSTEEDESPTVALTAPPSTVYVEALIYTQGQVDLNTCSLQAQQSDPAL